MIEKYRVIEYTNEDITELHQSWYETANTDKRVRQDSARRESKDEDLASVSEEVGIWKNACVEVVYLSTVRRWSISSIKDKIGIPFWKIKEIVRLFKNKIRCIKKINLTDRRKSKLKLQENHTEWIKAYVERKCGDIITWRKIKSSLTSEFPELKEFSDSTLWRHLTSKWGLRYK